LTPVESCENERALTMTCQISVEKQGATLHT
jgi:hypothetical protein